MIEKKETLLPLPLGVTKKKLHKMYHHVPTQVLKDEINAVIRKHRNIPPNVAVHSHTLLLPEFKSLIALLGYPKGYEKHFRE